MYYVGIDLGGTNIAAAVVDENYNILGRGKMKTNLPRPAEAIVDDMAAVAKLAIADSKLNAAQIKWVGVGCPGTVNRDTGIVEFSNNLGFKLLPLRDMLEQRLKMTVHLENDANAAAFGEALAGAAKGAKNAIAITLGTGVGGGEEQSAGAGLDQAAGARDRAGDGHHPGA